MVLIIVEWENVGVVDRHLRSATKYPDFSRKKQPKQLKIMNTQENDTHKFPAGQSYKYFEI